MGRLQAEGVRPRPDRAGVACVDVVFGRQTAYRGCVAEDGAEELGIARASAEFDG